MPQDQARRLSIVSTPTTIAPDQLPPFVDHTQRIAAHAAARPEDLAVACRDIRLTWAQFDRKISKVANALIGLGVRPDDKVAMLAFNSLEYFVTLFGCLRAGACAVPLATMAAADSLVMMLQDSGARVFFVAEAQRPLVDPHLDQLPAMIEGGLIGLDCAEGPWRSFADFLAGAAETAPVVDYRPEGHFNIIYSSGTTGTPKGILHARWMRFLQAQGEVAQSFIAPARTLISTPLYSNTTMAALLPTIYWGGSTVLMPKFDVEAWLRLAEAERITHTMLVPVQYQRLLGSPAFDRSDLSSFQMKLSTSAPLRAEVKEQIRTRWPGRMVEIYGLTEGGAACFLDVTAHPDKLASVGRPAPGAEIRLIDEAGTVVPLGEIGEICGRSATMMAGYYNKPDKTAEFLWTAPDGQVFFRQGDMGRFDEDGFLYLLDRKKDMIISGGFNIYATDLEIVIGRHPEVLDVAVIGVPSEEWGESPLALVVPRPGATVTPEALRLWANERLGKLQRLTAVEFRDTVPRSSIGKILKRELRAPYWEEAGRSI